ncbi:hypothetical protein [Nostoc sp. 'Lobaria pulmonaria (5183) cyanobiont']|uniref:hypothetical protein n=1 Tax=Nostoc sp. 'Lobaria pulmonaria (5183) cyanobiont' TaxID=1618022 RepID=UPI000CF3032F|nr:hypothetical protein [Nostoc sp. 'Lobaria pulmonaria (5183) cyanobiont']AVH69832.1 hypothetical protein NLP_0998 [Nostoc sp. 'Lobaria pulmonaria (5183) cyanobiont']
MFTIVLDGIKLDGNDIDFVTCVIGTEETEDFLAADGFWVTLTDSGLDKAGKADIFVTKDELDGNTYELLLDIIQPV